MVRSSRKVVVYADGREKHITANKVDDAFVSRLAEYMLKMTSQMPPRRLPSLAECRFCELTSADCLDRMALCRWKWVEGRTA